MAVVGRRWLRRIRRDGRADVAIADCLLAQWYLDYLVEEDGERREVLFHDLFEPVGHDFVCRDPEISDALSDGFERISADGSLAMIPPRYLSGDSVSDPLGDLEPRPQP